MSGIFAKAITIKNYKCFRDVTINLSVPDGEKIGSGLNILIGENGCGKTTVLEAYNFLTQPSYSIESRLSINEFKDFKEEMVIHADTDAFKCKLPYPGCYYYANGFEMTVKKRDRKAANKLLSTPFTITNNVIPTTENYFNSKGEESKKLNSLYTQFRDDVIDGNGIDVFFFDKYRTRQLSTGTYKTTFQRICDDLNWKFTKGITTEIADKVLQNISGDYFNLVNITAQKGTGAKLAHELSQYFGMDLYENLKIELLNLLHPFSEAFFAVRDKAELKQIKAKDLGSGIEMVLTLLLLKAIAGEAKGSIVYLIDEPELHLHPKAQDKLIEMLIEESKNKQIILSTHSPYIFKNCVKSAGALILMTQNEKKEIKICNAKENEWSIVPWGTSWGEVNYFAFNMPTIEFHNELYGVLHEKSGAINIDGFDKWLNEKHHLKIDKKWLRKNKDGSNKEDDVTLQTYIRHSMHHPENTLNSRYSDEQLIQSIEKLVAVAKAEK